MIESIWYDKGILGAKIGVQHTLQESMPPTSIYSEMIHMWQKRKLQRDFHVTTCLNY